MTGGRPPSVDPAAFWFDASLATALFAVDPARLGGIHVRSGPDPRRDALSAWVRAALPADSPVLRLPLHITEDRLLGGLSLAATLRAGRIVVERGLLAQANGGAVIVAMAERLESNVASHLCAALDAGVDRREIALGRDGTTASVACHIGLLALDEGIDDERMSDALRDRLAFHLDLSTVDPRAAIGDAPDPARVANARARLADVVIGDEVVEALSQAAFALGISSLRGPILAAAVARAHAALDGRTHVNESDAAAAARLVLGPRATRIPSAAEPETSAEETSEEPEAPPDGNDTPSESPTSPDDQSVPMEPKGALDEVILEAAKSAIPAGLLDAIALGMQPRSAARSSGHAGMLKASSKGGRPAGTRPGQPQNGDRLNLVETLRAAAPWQRLRRRNAVLQEPHDRPRIEVRKEDFRITRFKQRTESNIIFAVDASGSAALQRLAEAKGAVEQVLADCYVRRDHVALIAFRGTTATLLLPPTRSLARARRCLADLAGGGTTPIAAGIDAALALAADARKKGQTPMIVLMTDGRANVGRDGSAGSAAATADAHASASAVRAAGVRALFLDTAPRPRPQARALAAEMGARYLPLPYLDAAGISKQVQSLRSERAP